MESTTSTPVGTIDRLGDLDSALIDFKHAALALSAAWEHCAGNAIENYPFAESFDEIAAAISEMRVVMS